jgi:hypothetical protein
MSVPAFAAVREPSPPLATTQVDPGTDASFGARWLAWIAPGRQSDRAVKRNLRIALLCAVAIGLLVEVVFGVAAGAR